MTQPAISTDQQINPNVLNSRVLIVDDEPLNIALLSKMLAMVGYTHINSTTDSRQALELFKNFVPDIVLLDLQMPHMNGFQVLEKLNKIDPLHSVPVLILTSQSDADTRLRALENGAKDFINKPFNRTEVVSRIRNLLETRQLYNSVKNQNEHLDLLVQERTSKLQELNNNLEEKVTARTKDLKETNKALERTNNTMSELVSIVSHELRTPLTSIKSFAEILRDEEENLDTETKTKFLNIINDESDRLTRLISDLLDIQKISSGKMVWKQDMIDLSETLANTVEFFTPAFKDKNLTIDFIKEIPIAFCVTDADKIRQVLSNILSNALKFTQQGSVLVSINYKSNWARILFISDDETATEDLKKITKNCKISLKTIKCQEKAVEFLNYYSDRMDCAIVDMSSCDQCDASFIEYLRNNYTNLPIITLYESGKTRTSTYQVKTLRKPITDKDATELVLTDAIGISPQQRMLHISVKDSGMGIPKEHLSKVFTRFHQVDTSQIREQRGTGLGLSICKEIVNHYHGKLFVESEVGKGSTFHLILPETKEQKKKLGEILIEKGLVTEKQLTDALKDQT